MDSINVKPMNKENLYFIAVIPKRELREKITAIKQDFANRFNSKVALKVYPHITLKTPFKEPSNMHQKMIDWFVGLQINQQSFTIELKDFGAFPNRKNPVVYINPIATKELLLLQEKIMLSFIENISNFIDKSDIKFNPHCTVAYRDLDKNNFTKAWNEYQYKQFNASFEVNAFYLLQHDSKKWNIISTHNLS
jgi:2'-5' RNA ligase